ncbi:phosphatidylserine/phosphatidylglycerophosphate/cardiolipin synthase family protein [Candidatus Roizmanbacteria bacterium]|nr:phosphatidylserine/phosphatidylglycerophosphate/cardiolipin synthase family protein [Candidatus Roizmanbacteria bacterium]
MELIQTPSEFLDDFCKICSQAKKHIYIESMNFEYGTVLKRVEPILLERLEKGIKVFITFDWISRRYIDDELVLLPALTPATRAYHRSVFKHNEEFYQRLRKAGALLTVTNTPSPYFTSLIPIVRRNHTKMYIVDDICWIGGINMFDPGFQVIDFVMKSDNLKLIKALLEKYPRVNDKRPEQNYSTEIPQLGRLLFDVGKIGNSLIYNTLLEEIPHAQSKIVYMSQLIPEGRLLDLLIKKAREGVNVTIITSTRNNKMFAKFPFSFPYLVLKQKINNVPNIQLIHHPTRKIHAKLVTIDNATAIFGSHNYVETGVNLGTEELALKTHNPSLLSQLGSFVGESILY